MNYSVESVVVSKNSARSPRLVVMFIDLIKLLLVCWLRTLQIKRALLQAHSSKLLSSIVKWIVGSWSCSLVTGRRLAIPCCYTLNLSNN